MEDAMELRKHSRWLSLEQGDLLPVLLLIPIILVVLIVMILPLIFGGYVSLFDYRAGVSVTRDDFAGLQNYVNLLGDTVFWQSLRNTMLFAVLATAGDIVIGTLMAVLLLRVHKKLAAFVRAVYLVPLLVSPIIIGLIWSFMFDPGSGPVYWALSWFNMGIKQFPGVTSSSTALISVVIAHWWQVVPFVMLVVTAGLVSIPNELYEAAYLDGAGEFRKFFSISLPSLKHVYMVILVIAGVDTVKVFDIILSLTGGGPANSTISLSMHAYNQAFRSNNMGYAMVISIATMIVTFIVFGIPFIRFSVKKD